MTDPTYARAVQLLEAEVGDELLTLDPEGGHCFGFSEVAAAVWRRLERPCTFSHLRTSLLEEFEVSEQQCTAELQGLLETLAAQNLVRRLDDSREETARDN